ncbi:MAG: dUTP diphosphatase [Anoxybacillus ayderensis]|nr:dUTP diphosphatase [Anoxybacillus ayderensis]
MNLRKLFEMQRELDERIVREKGLEGQNLLPNKILALQVELAELANEWQGFKYWKRNREPRTVLTEIPSYAGIPFFADAKTRNPMLEEYVDCLHFLLSIGLESEIGTFTGDELMPIKMGTVEIQFITLFKATVTFLEDINYYPDMWELFLGLGEMLGFTWNEVEEAYIAKNKINHQRQDGGY